MMIDESQKDTLLSLREAVRYAKADLDHHNMQAKKAQRIYEEEQKRFNEFLDQMSNNVASPERGG